MSQLHRSTSTNNNPNCQSREGPAIDHLREARIRCGTTKTTERYTSNPQKLCCLGQTSNWAILVRQYVVRRRDRYAAVCRWLTSWVDRSSFGVVFRVGSPVIVILARAIISCASVINAPQSDTIRVIVPRKLIACDGQEQASWPVLVKNHQSRGEEEGRFPRWHSG